MASGENLSLEPGSAQNLLYSALLNKLGDNNPRLREKSEEVLIQMALSGSFGPEKVVNNILKTVNAKKGGSSVKHIVGRHQVMHKILERSFETASTNGINYETCF